MLQEKLDKKAKDTFLLLVQNAVLLVISFSIHVIVARGLTKEHYGLLTYLSSIVSFLGFLGLSSLSTATTSTTARKIYGNFYKSSKQIILVGTVGGICLSLVSIYWYLYNSDKLMSLMFFLIGLHGPGLWFSNHIARWAGERKYQTIFKFKVSLRLAELTLTFLLVRLFAKPIPLIVSYFSLRTIANLVIVFHQLREKSLKKLNMDFDEAAHKYGWRTSLYGNVLTVTAEQIHRVFFGAYFGPIAFASFGIGEIVRSIGFSNLYQIYQTISVPILAKKTRKDAVDKTDRIFFLFLLVFIALGLLAALVIKPLILFAFGDKYSDSIHWAYAFILLSVIGAPSKLILPVFKAQSLTRQTLISFWVSSVGKLIIIPCMGLLYGQMGVLWGMYVAVILSGIVTVVQFIELKKTMSVVPSNG